MKSIFPECKNCKRKNLCTLSASDIELRSSGEHFGHQTLHVFKIDGSKRPFLFSRSQGDANWRDVGFSDIYVEKILPETKRTDSYHKACRDCTKCNAGKCADVGKIVDKLVGEHPVASISCQSSSSIQWCHKGKIILPVNVRIITVKEK